MTVRETIDFSARCQGVGSRAGRFLVHQSLFYLSHPYEDGCALQFFIWLAMPDIMIEVSRREKELGVMPDPDIDTYMKVVTIRERERERGNQCRENNMMLNYRQFQLKDKREISKQTMF